MKDLYQGRLAYAHAEQALEELRQAKSTLEMLPPSAVVWDIENRSAKAPWGDNISPNITSLGNYFVSSTGRDVFGIFEEALQASAKGKCDAVLA